MYILFYTIYFYNTHIENKVHFILSFFFIDGAQQYLLAITLKTNILTLLSEVVSFNSLRYDGISSTSI